jgi:hypothetical protein
MKIYVFGSRHNGDHIAFKVAKDLEGSHDFVFSNDPTDLMYESNIVIMDAVKGIKEVTIFYNAKDFQLGGIVSLHDFDLGYFLKLAERLRLEKRITVLGLPMEGNFEVIRKQAADSLRQLQDSFFR